MLRYFLYGPWGGAEFLASTFFPDVLLLYDGYWSIGSQDLSTCFLLPSDVVPILGGILDHPELNPILCNNLGRQV